MNKFAEITVVEFKNGKDVETWESDKDVRTGTYGRELLNRVEIRWNDDGTVEWVKSDMLRKYNSANYILTRPVETDILPSADNTPATVEALETALSGDLDKALEMTKPARKPRAAAKQA